MNEKIRAARKAGRVTRYHTSTLLRGEDVAQHTFNMMNIIMILTEGHVSNNLLKAALMHDQGEYVTGDIPSPIKRIIEVPLLKSMEEQGVNFIHTSGMPILTEWEQLIMKVADNLDGLLKCTEELEMGNRSVSDVGRTYCSYVLDHLPAIGGGYASEKVKYCIDYFNSLEAKNEY